MEPLPGSVVEGVWSRSVLWQINAEQAVTCTRCFGHTFSRIPWIRPTYLPELRYLGQLI